MSDAPAPALEHRSPATSSPKTLKEIKSAKDSHRQPVKSVKLKLNIVPKEKPTKPAPKKVVVRESPDILKKIMPGPLVNNNNQEIKIKPAHEFKATNHKDLLKEIMGQCPEGYDKKQMAQDKKIFNDSRVRFGPNALIIVEGKGLYILRGMTTRKLFSFEFS